MKIAVCVKQVPAGAGTVMDAEKGVIMRIAADSKMNPYDLYAVEAALRIAEALNATLTAFTMGPQSAEKVLREAMAMGADDAVLLTDKAFAGADVYATSYTLAEAMKKSGGFDIIVCGQQTTDGDTAQLPFSLGARLGMPVFGWVTAIESISENSITIIQEITEGSQKISAPLPLCLAVSKSTEQPRIPTLANRLSAKKKPLTILGIDSMEDKHPEHYGLKASPTQVKKIYTTKTTHKTPPIKAPPNKAAKIIKELVDNV